MVQVCAAVLSVRRVLYEAAAIHASDGDLVCVELDHARRVGCFYIKAVAALPAALVAVTCAALVLYWAAVPIASQHRPSFVECLTRRLGRRQRYVKPTPFLYILFDFDCVVVLLRDDAGVWA